MIFTTPYIASGTQILGIQAARASHQRAGVFSTCVLGPSCRCGLHRNVFPERNAGVGRSGAIAAEAGGGGGQVC